MADKERAAQDNGQMVAKIGSRPSHEKAEDAESVFSVSGSSTTLNNDNDQMEYPSRLRLVLLTPGVMAAVFMVALDNYILATAIPRIADEFSSLSAVGWYASSYFLTQMAFQPAFGHLFSTLSVKALYIFAMVVFEVGSIICATAHSSTALIIGRLVAGAGGAGLYVGTLTLTVYVVPINKRPLYLSLITSMFGVASVAGPLLGGVFTDSHKLTWRFCFWINLPIGLIAAVLIGLCYRDPKRSQGPTTTTKNELKKIDLGGLVCLLAAFVCFTSALQWGGISYAWSDSKVWGCLLGFGLLSIAFVVLQFVQKSRSSIPIHIFSRRIVASTTAFILFISMSVGSLIYYLPFYFQTVRAQDASASGVDNLPFLVTMLFSPILSGIIASASGLYIQFLWCGPILAAVGSGLLTTLDGDSQRIQVDAYQFLAGLGLGICTQIPFTAVQAVLPPDMLVMGSSLVSFGNSMGPVIGTNIAQSIFTNILIKALRNTPGISVDDVVARGIINTSGGPATLAVRDSFALALSRAYLVPVVCCGLAFLCSLFVQWVNIKQKK